MVYEIAGLRILIENRCRYTTEFCKAYLAQDQSSPVHISASITDEEFYAEKAALKGFSDGYIENICLYRKICSKLPSLNRLLLHAAVLRIEGKGYAFLGKSGTGKSTHSRLWMQYLQGVQIINGDKPILQKTGGGFVAFGTPWNGKEGLGEKIFAPLAGLCFLEQAKTNAIIRLSSFEAAKRIVGQIIYPNDQENAAKTLELIDELVRETPCWLLQCDVSEQAAKTSFEAMTGKRYGQYKKGD